jgi:hypothetical protein
MAYDRYDDRGGNRSRGRDEDRYSSGERNDRGFFERARDEVSSWFSEEDSERQRMHDDRSSGRDNMNWSRGDSPDAERGRYNRDDERRYGSPGRNQGSFGSSNEPWGRGHDDDRYARSPERGGMSGRDQERGRGGMFSHDDHDRSRGREGYDRGGNQGRGYPGTLGQSAHGDRDRDYGRGGGRYGRDHDDGYRPMTGDYGRGGAQQNYRSGMGGQDFARSQYGRQDFSQDQANDRQGGRTYNYGGWGDRDSQQQSSRGGGVDDHYSQWRQRQIQELDRDYHDYRQEHQSKFENEFSGWRQQKQTKRQMLNAIREHMEVVDESGEHIGSVDKVRDDRIILTRTDPSAGGVHRSFGCTMLERVEDKVYLTGTAATIRNQLREEDNDRGRDDSRGGGFFGGLFGGGRSDDDRRDERPEERSTSTNRPEGEGPHVLDRSFSGTYDDDDKK